MRDYEQVFNDYVIGGLVKVTSVKDGFKFKCKNGFVFKALGDNKRNYEKIVKVVETLGGVSVQAWCWKAKKMLST